KSLVAPPVPPAPTEPGPFLCYKVIRAKGTPAFVSLADVATQDQFATLAADVKKPSRLCLQASLGGPAPTPGLHLVCYKTGGTPRLAKRTAFVLGGFGGEPLAVSKVAEVCVPSQVTVP